MRLSFDSIDEVKEFVKGLKGTRGGKGGDADEGQTAGTPAPLQPPATQPGPFNPAAFAPQGAGVAQAAAAFPAAGAIGPAPEVLALVQRISAKIDGAIASGQPAENVLAWFRSQCGPEAAQASMDQIKSVVMPRMAMPALAEIAKLMNA